MPEKLAELIESRDIHTEAREWAKEHGDEEGVAIEQATLVLIDRAIDEYMRKYVR
jgi:hypothetical protein